MITKGGSLSCGGRGLSSPVCPTDCYSFCVTTAVLEVVCVLAAASFLDTGHQSHVDTDKLIADLEKSLPRFGKWQSRRMRDKRSTWMQNDTSTHSPGYVR